jgi:hypothetical protein
VVTIAISRGLRAFASRAGQIETEQTQRLPPTFSITLI